jgi:hypothetical protein
MTDWSKVKFRASSWGNLMTEPREKAAKERGDLSKTCQKELIKIYNLVKYGRKKDIVTKAMTKGMVCEQQSIELFSFIEDKPFVKNQDRLENEWFVGHPDIFAGESIRKATEVHDIKTPWDLDTFMPILVEDIEDGYDFQLQAYFDLTGAKEGSVAYCLVDTPDEMIQDELMYLKTRMNLIDESVSPEYQAAAAEIIKNMTFKDIGYAERVIKKPVVRDDATIQSMKDKVPRLRGWLAWFENLHMNGMKPTAPAIDISSIPLIKIKQ